MLTFRILDDPHYKQRELIAGVEYVFVLNYYDRQSAWFLDLLDDQEDPIRRGMRLTPGWNPLLRSKDTRLPPGELYVFSTIDPIAREGFNTGDAQLVYFTPAEVAEFTATADSTQPTVLFG